MGVAGAMYLVLTASFFAACAYAQLNDPDPELWIFLYLLGGVGLNSLFWICAATQSPAAEANVKMLALGFIRVCCAYGGWLAYAVHGKFSVGNSPPLELNLSSFQGRGWELLEFEEGREFAGLFMLGIHSVQLVSGTHCAKPGAPGPTATATSKVMAVMVTIVLSAAVYMWYMYQPELNRRFREPHCDGQLQPDRDEAPLGVTLGMAGIDAAATRPAGDEL